MTDKPKAVCGRPSLKRWRIGFPPPPTLGLCLGAFWGGMGIQKKTILKPSLNINNNFNHREKNVIIHPQLIPEDEFEALFQKKTLSSKMRNGSSYTWKARGWWHKSGNVHCKIARDDRCWKLQVKLADEKCWNKMIKSTSESTVRGTFLVGLTIEFYLDKRWETVACCMLPY